ncbi:helix-turn-helix domain-containing protein [uncultured Methylobacterium sp.]|uniref:helix-turn-helix domain-containing protein n=1 Tax=uncultured Methylobacterium sp. TaxID=157278 RepID=UPI0035C98235
MTNAEQKKPTDADHGVGSRIALLRAARGISQTALGQALGVSFQQVQKYEKGRNRVGAGRLRTIADHLGVPVSTFFEVEADGTGPSDGAAPPFLGLPGAVDLLKAYGAIADPQMRRDVLTLVKSAARLASATGASGTSDAG